MSQTPSSSETPKSGWTQAIRGNVLMMGLVSLFTDFSSEMMNPLLPFFLAGMVASGAEVAFWLGIVEGVAEATASLLKIFSGRISDKLGKRKLLVIIGYGLSAFSRPIMALAMAPLHVVGLKFADRIGKGIRTSPRDALIGDSVSKEYRGLAFSFHRALDHTGAVLGPTVAIIVLYCFLGDQFWTHPAPGVELPPTPPDQMTALRWLFAIALIPGLAAVASLVFKVKEVAPKASLDNKNFSAWRSLGGRFYAFVAVVTIFALGNSSDLFLVLLARDHFGLGMFQIILFWIVLHTSKIVFSIPGGMLSDRLGRRPLIVTGWIIYALVYLGMAVSDPAQVWQFWALICLYGVYYGLTEGAEKALVTDFVPSQYRGTAFGVYHGAVGLALLPASVLFGILWKVSNGPFLPFVFGAVLAGVAAVLLMVLLATSRPKPAAA